MSDLFSRGLNTVRSLWSSSPSSSSKSFSKFSLGPVTDLSDGQMREVSLEHQGRPFKVLLSRVRGKLHATSHLCPHYKARLVTGVLTSEGTVVCPWHAACFSVQSGDIEEAPSLEALKTYEIGLENDEYYVLVDTNGRLPRLRA